MNEIISLEKLSGQNEINIKKSAYRSIIYCFLGKATIKNSDKEYVLEKNKFAVLSESEDYIVSQGADTETAVIEISEASVSSGFTSRDDLENLPLAFFINEIYRYDLDKNSKNEVCLNALGDVIVAYVSNIVGKGSADGFCSVIEEKIRDNVSNAEFNVEAFLATLPVNSDYAKKVYKKKNGVTPKEHLIKLRLDKARMILSGTDRFNYTVKSVALSCGYNDPLYFSRSFKKRFNYAPNDYAHRFDKPVAKKKSPVGAVLESLEDFD